MNNKTQTKFHSLQNGHQNSTSSGSHLSTILYVHRHPCHAHGHTVIKDTEN